MGSSRTVAPSLAPENGIGNTPRRLIGGYLCAALDNLDEVPISFSSEGIVNDPLPASRGGDCHSADPR
jgi:hypothetical protein